MTKKPKKEMKWLTVRIPDEMHKALKIKSAEEGESIQSYVTVALAAHCWKKEEMISYET